MFRSWSLLAALPLAATAMPQTDPARLPLLVPGVVTESVLPGTAKSVALQRDTLASLRDGVPAGTRVAIPTGPGSLLELVVEASSRSRLGATVLRGHVADGGTASSFGLATDGRKCALFAHTSDGRVYALRSGGGEAELTRFDGDAFSSCGVNRDFLVAHAPEPTSVAIDPSGPAAAQGGVSFDVLVLHTPAVSALAGGPVGLLLEVEAALAEANQALVDSQAGSVAFALTGVLPVDYDEAGGTHTDHLAALSDPDDGTLDAALEWREAAGADLVSLIVDDDDGGTTSGLGFILPPFPLPFAPDTGPFNTVDYGSLANLELPHQLGHNAGCAHDYDNAEVGVPEIGVGPLPYPATPMAFGWRWTGTSANAYRSVMALGSGTRVARFSNPDVLFDGVATGKESGGFLDPAADNAGSLLEVATRVADFQPTPPTLTEVYVDLDLATASGDGSESAPYAMLEEGLLRVASGGSIFVRGTGLATPPVLTPVRIRAWTAPGTLLD